MNGEESMVPLAKARARLATVWLVCSGFVFFIVMAQCAFGKYMLDGVDHSSDIWKWLLPNLLPTLTTMVAALAATWSTRDDAQSVRRDFYHFANGLSWFYLLLLIGLLLSQPFAQRFGLDQIRTLQNSSLGMGPLQGLVAAALGVLFATGKSVVGKPDGLPPPAGTAADGVAVAEDDAPDPIAGV
jgi:uncharacterized membrane protein